MYHIAPQISDYGMFRFGGFKLECPAVEVSISERRKYRKGSTGPRALQSPSVPPALASPVSTLTFLPWRLVNSPNLAFSGPLKIPHLNNTPETQAGKPQACHLLFPHSDTSKSPATALHFWPRPQLGLYTEVVSTSLNGTSTGRADRCFAVRTILLKNTSPCHFSA